MKTNKTITLYTLYISICILAFVQSSRNANKMLVLQPDIAAAAVSNSLSTDKFVATTSDAAAQALQGHTATGAASAQATSDRLSTTSSVTAVADSRHNKEQQAVAHQETSSAFSTGQEEDAFKEQIDSNSYKTSLTKTTALNDQVTYDGTNQFQINQDKTLTSENQTIRSDQVQTSTAITQTGSVGVLEEQSKSKITINLDTSGQDVIIERIISTDERVVIVSAAKFIASALQEIDKNTIQQLIKGQCNCKQVKNYLIEMLAEA